VFFVAHSLGCRVVLEALYAIAVQEEEAGHSLGAPVRGVFLMAGAVPFALCEDQDGRIFRRRNPDGRATG
jgi:predicted alpha/beta hydrolase family esterase